MKTIFSVFWGASIVLGNMSCVTTNRTEGQTRPPVSDPPRNSPPKTETVEVTPPPPPPPTEDPDAVYQMRQMHLLEWIEKVKRDCERTRSVDAWMPARDEFPPEEIEIVKKRCIEAVEVGLRGDAWTKAMSACANRFAQANGRGKHQCRLAPHDVPNVPPELFDLHKSACTASCAEAGAEEIEMRKHRAEFVICCDGSTSPTCTYGSIHFGCCAGHGGVCID